MRKGKWPHKHVHCAHCGEWFVDLDTWYYHRRGPLDARRCMPEAELRRHGLRKTPRTGRWKHTTLAERKAVGALKKRVYEQHRPGPKSSPPGD